MNKLERLKKITTKPALANLLEVNPSFLTHVLYILKPNTQYTTFTIPKKSGGIRTIKAPSVKLKSLQSNLSKLLLDCIDEINKSKSLEEKNYKQTLSHGFVRKRSIMTNALMHLNQKNVLNIDLKDFFDSFNFGRVRGFFIKNHNFQLDPAIATVIAQIACDDNKLPQGSPCSPVITNLITHSLDIKLASLARKHSCIYSRYADDMTFSTRKSVFPQQIICQEGDHFVTGKNMNSEIVRAGFSINENKTRIQYKDSRQDVTGLIVNKKPNVKKEYWRTVKSQCHSLFRTGTFTKKTAAGVVAGNIKELEGQLNFIDQVDRFNRPRQKAPLNPIYQYKNYGNDKTPLLSGREKTFSKFLYYRLFYGNTKPTILCEGKTDNTYLKSAISILAGSYPILASAKTRGSAYELLIRTVKYSKRTRFLLGLYGGAPYLCSFIKAFEKHYKFHKASKPKCPVVIVLDNDSGFKNFPKILKGIKSATPHPTTLESDDYRNAEFIHVIHNLYIVLTPLRSKGEETDIEYLFDDATRLKQHSGKCFNIVDKRNDETDLSKDAFAKHIIKAQKASINFDGLRPLLDRITSAINHYN
ncbi:MAG: retron Ec67 family RNA-directed DNA polymerase/endonuclease [Zetaproteobacteria bacterium]|nr:retron Ec67 family RNA-directed DNA polymerase/endonuclease [Zetaproteobacteria bacterium]